MKSFLFGLTLIALTQVSGCKKEETATQVSSSAPSAALAPMPAAQAVTAGAKVSLESIPVEEEFEEEAAEEVSAANLEQKLDSLEKEMASD